MKRSYYIRIICVWLVTWMITSGLSIGICSAEYTNVSAMDFVIDIEGYSRWVNTYTYEGYSGQLQSWGVSVYDYLRGDVKPKQIVYVKYTEEVKFEEVIISVQSVHIEIYEYETQEAAEVELEKQKPTTSLSDLDRKIWHRFETEEFLFQESNFLVFAYCTPGYFEDGHSRAVGMLNYVLDAFVRNFAELVSQIPPPPPETQYAREVVWGIQPGDIITWERQSQTQYSAATTDTVSYNIVGFSEDNFSVYCRESAPYRMGAYHQPGDWGAAARNSDRGMVFYNSTCFDEAIFEDLLWYKHFWVAGDNGGLGGSTRSDMLVYPLYYDGEYFVDMDLEACVEFVIGSFPDTLVSQGTDYISGHGKTEYVEGVPSLLDEWVDITVHKGTGIVTSKSYYFDDKEYGAQSSYSYTLTSTNFDLNSRLPYTPPENGEPDEGNGSTIPTNGEPHETSQADSSTFIDSPLLLVGAVVAIVVIITVIVVAVILMKKKK